uniref:dUTP diphosphatase n=1 Tax=viral metagenome TaxID=1070528 RepID=A0A6C0JT01_9ZZZZ
MSLQTVLEDGAILPVRGTTFSAGLDLFALEDTVVNEIQSIVKTGVKMAIPEGYVGLIWSRSSMAYKNGVFTEAGVIDSDYRANIGVVMFCNKGTYQIRKGDKIAQILIQPVSSMNCIQVEQLANTERTGGFGSTGK